MKCLKQWLRSVIRIAIDLSESPKPVQKAGESQQQAGDEQGQAGGEEKKVVTLQNVLASLQKGDGFVRKIWINQKKADKCKNSATYRRKPVDMYGRFGLEESEHFAEGEADSFNEEEEEDESVPEADDEEEEEEEEDDYVDRKEDKLAWKGVEAGLARLEKERDNAAGAPKEKQWLQQEDLICFGFPSLFDICCGVIFHHGITQQELDSLPEEVSVKVIQFTPYSLAGG